MQRSHEVCLLVLVVAQLLLADILAHPPRLGRYFGDGEDLEQEEEMLDGGKCFVLIEITSFALKH